jgi:hypothetical protein
MVAYLMLKATVRKILSNLLLLKNHPLIFIISCIQDFTAINLITMMSENEKYNLNKNVAEFYFIF